MDKDETKKSLLEEYTELTKNSLVKVQYSCGGNSTSIDEPEGIPIVPESYIPESTVNYTMAREEDAEAIGTLLRTNNLPVKDLATGQRTFIVALSEGKTVGCVAIEVYGTAGLLRSLAVHGDLRGKGIGQKLVAEAENWSRDNGLKDLYLLTTTAAGFFPKSGWKNTERLSVPENIAASSEFASVCPSTAVCMSKTLN
ncbi:MAG: arsenic resistance N-acetyltransferase ArsN2 [Paludibacter sp.]